MAEGGSDAVEEREGLGFEERVVGDGEEDEGRVDEEGVGAVMDGVGEEGEVGLLGLVSNTCCASLAVYEKSYADIS